MSSVETMKGWARLVKSEGDLPSDLARYYLSKFQSFDEDVYGVYIPKYNNKVSTHPKLAVLKDGHLHIAEKTASGIAEKSCRLEDIFYLEKKTVLLDSKLYFKASTQEGCFDVKLEYNSVGDELFEVIIRNIRAASPAVELPMMPEADAVDYLKEADIKFYNYFNMSTDTKDTLLAHIYQPEIRDEKRWGFPMLISGTHLLTLSNRELISIREEGSRRRRRRDYGGIWTFIPVGCIAGVVPVDVEGKPLSLKVKLQSGYEMELLFSSGKKAELEQFVVSFEGLKAN